MPQIPADISFKRGDSFQRAGAARLPSTKNWIAARCSFKSLDPTDPAVVGSFLVSLTPYVGQQPSAPALPYTHSLTLTATSAMTVNWPLGTYAFDIEFHDDAVPVPFVFSTKTKRLLIERDIT